ncbi:N-acetyltransferase [Salinimicrobium sp. GXAS 041]|uniref:N-acetyltransferase n=1 Tax=Salinimicrobium sp. GXAS 041 TaxID=3400806 RepID=UPI003C783EBB
MQTELPLSDNEFLRQFESTIEGELVKIEYSQQERKIFLTKIVMSEELREKGYLETFIKTVLDHIKEQDSHRVVPTSPLIAKYMRKNKRKYKDLLPVGINI